MIVIIILTSLIHAIAVYIDKHLVNKGISRNDYFYYMCLSMIPFSFVMTIIEIVTKEFRFELSIIPIILLCIAMYIRYKKQHTIVGYMKYLNPYETVTYTSLGLVLAFIIDSVVGLKQFSIVVLLAIVLTIVGVFLLADVKLKRKSLQKDLIIKIVCTLAMGYIAHFILKFWSNAFFILTLNLFLTLIFSKNYTLKYYKNHYDILKWVFIQQIFGFVYIYLANYISSYSVTMSSFIAPISIVFTIIIAFLLKNSEKKPKFKDIIAVILVACGILILSY